MTTSQTFRFPVHSFRHLETPFSGDGLGDYFAIVEVRDLPDFSDWRKINVRDPKLKGSVPRAIREGFQDQPALFTFMNRGLVVAAAGVHFDNKTGELDVTLRDPNLHGLLDGGHSYNIIREETEGLTEEDHRYVKVEFLVGFGTEDILNVVDARNTSNQVADESLMNLQGTFQRLKTALNDEPYAEKIAWKEYQTDEEGDPLPIDVREVIAILMAFDRDNFDHMSHPINSYRSKAAALKHFKENQASFEKLYPIANQLLRLHDEIYLALPDLYNKARKSSDDVSGGKFGRLTGVTKYEGKKKARLHFIGKDSTYGVPGGFVYPILGAFRALLTEKNGNYRWAEGLDPVAELKNGLGIQLATILGNFALESQNPSKVGKSPNVWQSCYQAARLYFLESTTR